MKRNNKKKPYASAEPYFKKAMKNPESRFLYEEEMAKMEITKAVRNTRVHAHLTQAALAKKMKISQSLIARFPPLKEGD